LLQEIQASQSAIDQLKQQKWLTNPNKEIIRQQDFHSDLSAQQLQLEGLMYQK